MKINADAFEIFKLAPKGYRIAADLANYALHMALSNGKYTLHIHDGLAFKLKLEKSGKIRVYRIVTE